MRPALLAGVLGACSFTPGTLPKTDGQPLDAAADALVLGPWGAPTVVVLPPPTDTDDDPTLTGDRLEMYINTTRAGNADVYVTVRSTLNAAWSLPIFVPMISSNANETTPEVSADGLTMIVASDRVGTMGGNDLWISTRASRSAGWGDPTQIIEVSSSSSEACGSITADGQTMVFTSTRIDGSPDVFTADRVGSTGPWNTPIQQTAVNTNGHEGSAVLSDDGLTLYLDTNREGNLDLYMARRASRTEPFGAPAPIAEIKTTFNEQDPWVSPDGRHLMFSSDRGGSNQLWEATR